MRKPAKAIATSDPRALKRGHYFASFRGVNVRILGGASYPHLLGGVFDNRHSEIMGPAYRNFRSLSQHKFTCWPSGEQIEANKTNMSQCGCCLTLLGIIAVTVNIGTQHAVLPIFKMLTLLTPSQPVVSGAFSYLLPGESATFIGKGNHPWENPTVRKPKGYLLWSRNAWKHWAIVERTRCQELGCC